ncbi:beta strand repeat-containing protein [Ramlibacter sp. PS4R-6]|uniref:beta strand repeat-containing protein n=1 Tax=Ramlibacter sp. PS4R-6 TaxID=3133438 RepID=UPI00309A099B
MTTTIAGSSGSDTLTALAEGSRISAGAGDDILVGGSGSDTLNGDAGDDAFIYNISQNAGSSDVYTGGAGIDSLLIQFTLAQWLDIVNQQQVAAYLAHLAKVTQAQTGQVSNGIASDFTFRFGTSTLKVQSMESLRITVDGAVIDPANAFVFATADSASAVEDGGAVAINVLANDSVADLVKDLKVVSAPTHGTATLVKPDAANPASWRFDYQADNAHYQYLAAGETATDTFTYQVTDANDDFATATVTVTITGTNDQPTISAATASGAVTEDAANPNLAASGTVAFDDKDLSDVHTVKVTVRADNAWGGIVTAGVTTAATGAAGGVVTWSYSVPNANTQALGEGQKATEYFDVVISDAHGGSVTQTLSVVVTGVNDPAVLSADVRDLTEGDTAAALGSSGTLTVADIDGDDTFQAQPASAGKYGTFAIDAGGAWTYTASSAHDEFVAGATYTDTFAVKSADGTATSVTVNMLGTNDAAVLSSDTKNLTEADTAAALGTSGTLTITDVDSAETFKAQAGTAGKYGTFAIDAAGAWSFASSSAHDEFVAGTTYTDTFAVESADGTATSVTVNMLGTNDAAVLSSDTKNLTESDTALGTGGALTITDVDSPETFKAQAGTAGKYGAFAIDAAGAWTFTASSAHDEFVAGTTYTDTFAVESADGTATSVTVNMLGTNDAAVLSSDTKNLTEANTAAALGASGTLTITDVDSAETFKAQAGTAGKYGAFAIDAAGAWTYTASSAHDEFVVGTTYTDTFAVESADGTATSITINILGTNDAAVLSSDTKNLTEADTAAAIGTSGTLTVTDADSAATFAAQAGSAGKYGTFAIDAAGAWTYAASSAHDEFVAGTTYSDAFAVSSADGTTSTVTINIAGTNDAAVLSADVRNLTEGNTPAALSTAGTLTISDVDSAQTFVTQGASAGTYGTFAVDAAGAWTYTASTAHDEFIAGTTYTDSFIVAAADGMATSVTIHMLGTAETPVGPTGGADRVITNVGLGTAFTVPEWALLANDTLTAGGTLDVAGVSAATGLTATHLAGTGSNGTVTVTDAAPAGGSFSYTPTDGTGNGAPTAVAVTQGTLSGTSGSDILVSGSGGSTLNGGAGNDILLGGSGNDTYIFGLGDGNDSISDGGGGNDALQVATTAPTDSLSLGTLGFEQVGNDLVVKAGGTEIVIKDHYSTGTIESVTFTNGGTYQGYAIGTTAYRIGTTLGGTGQEDVIASSVLGQALTGGNGNDMLFGNGGADTINGGTGDDLVVAGDGADRLLGAAGNDFLVGGTGSDTFVFNTAPGAAANVDRLRDFDANGADRIELSAGTYGGIALGAVLAAADFASVASGTGAGAAVGGAVNIVFDANGDLYYDSDGGSAANRTLIAKVTLVGGTFDNADFVVVA